jgi:hypothetical protein
MNMGNQKEVREHCCSWRKQDINLGKPKRSWGKLKSRWRKRDNSMGKLKRSWGKRDCSWRKQDINLGKPDRS